jgi:hypothetical protein
MEVTLRDGRWYGKKNKKAKTTEDITDIVKIDGDFMSVMGKSGRTTFHAYLAKSGNRWLEMHGVTSLLDYWGTKENLLQWAVNQAVDFASAELNSNQLYTEDELTEILEEARSAHKRSLNKAGDHGTDTHGLVERWVLECIKINDHADLDSEQMSHEGVVRFAEWVRLNNVKFLASEMPVHSKKFWTAGTMDIFCEIDGKKTILDIKTSNYVSFKNFVQCAAYALMLEEMTDEKIEMLAIAHLPRSGGFNTHFEEDVERYKRAFESLVSLVKLDKDKSYQLYSS